MTQPKLGRPFSYEPDKHLKPLTEAVNDVLALGQVAGLCGIAKTVFLEWLKKGDEDLKNNPNSEFAQLASAIRKAQAEKAKQLITEALKGKKNAKVCMWLLKVCLRDDFGDLNEEIKELFASFKQLSEDVKRYKDNPLQGM